ncbi:Type 1 glutamine amidotransferase-like domain-containing protein [Clostridium felsineum]|uniref:Type 1 glutamine amidotransferase-like domain-containing protein n=1 Tax=Clostridium felsineum TaxID=36839 RepID=UPI00098C8DAA|nr:Type 1 glutamine amidotransferase-like domain-containing protein [Clostridium felsineum]URZ17138.1 hypothetical protein CLFE_031900 [Clostridium felsineum DSM 794]
MINILLSMYNFHEAWAKGEVEKYIKPKDKVVVIPFSFGPEVGNIEDWNKEYNKKDGKHYKGFTAPFLYYGIKEENIELINYFVDSKNEAKRKIRNSNIVFFTGGLPDKMMLRLKEFDLIEELENFKGIIIGSSAGAMIQFYNYHITPDKDYRTFSYNRGLDLIRNFQIEVHYEKTEVQKSGIAKVLKEKTGTVYAISNKGGIIVYNNQVEILGDVEVFKN